MGLTVSSSSQLVDVLDERGGRGLARLFHRLARELTAAETEALRVVTDPPGEGAALTARLLTAPTLAVELARRGVTVEVGGLAEAEFWSVYQPIVSLADRSVVAHEALLRGRSTGATSVAAISSSSPNRPAGCTGWTGSAASRHSPARRPGSGATTST